MRITGSLSNNKIKEIRKLHQKKYRDELNLFIAEGQKALEEIISSNIEIVEIFSLKELKLNFDKITYVKVDEMKKISTTSSPCEVMTIAKKRKNDVKSFSNLNKLILLESISDPGNLGTIIRSAAAFGVDGIILFGNCVELYSPKVIRSSAGNFFKIPVINLNSTDDIKNYFPSHKIISTSLSNENNISIKSCLNNEKMIIMFGAEACGLSSNLTNISQNNIKLEMKNKVESLNLSVSVSIILYELMQSSV